MASEGEVALVHETRSSEVPNNELEGVQRSAEVTRLTTHLARPSDELARPGKWQALTSSDLQ